MPAWQNAIKLHAGYAFVSSTGARLYVFDLSDPAQPTMVNECPTVHQEAVGAVANMTVHNGELYLASNGLKIWDVSAASEVYLRA
jgi:hypothetical protein